MSSTGVYSMTATPRRWQSGHSSCPCSPTRNAIRHAAIVSFSVLAKPPIVFVECAARPNHDHSTPPKLAGQAESARVTGCPPPERRLASVPPEPDEDPASFLTKNGPPPCGGGPFASSCPAAPATPGTGPRRSACP